MKRSLIALACIAPLVLAGCLSPYEERQIAGAAIGSGLGYLTAKALDANEGWVVLTTLAGAAAGTLVARNTARGTCAYANGDGTYREEPC